MTKNHKVVRECLQFSLLCSFVLLTSCIGQQQNSSCPSNQSFNTSTRTCIDNDLTENANHRPVVGADQTVTATENGSAVNFELNYGTDQDGDKIYYMIDVLDLPSKGTLTNCLGQDPSTILTDRSCTYTPTANEAGEDTIVYRVYDGINYSVSYATVTITIAGTNDDPVFVKSLDAAYDVDEDAVKEITFSADEGGGSDENTQTIEVNVVSGTDTVIDSANINIYYGAALKGPGGTTWYQADPTGDYDAKASDIKLVITPTTVGTETITVSIRENGVTVIESFVITVNAVSSNAKFISDPATVVTWAEDATPATTTFMIDEGGGTDEDKSEHMFIRVLVINATNIITSNDVIIKRAGIEIGRGGTSYISVGDGNENASKTGGDITLEFDPIAEEYGSAALSVEIIAIPTTTTTPTGSAEATKYVSVVVTDDDDDPTVALVVAGDKSGVEETMLSVALIANEGGGSDEITQILQVKAVSSNTDLLKSSGIVIKWGTGTATLDSSTYYDLDNATESADLYNLNLELTPETDPASTVSRDTNVTVYVRDKTSLVEVSVTFKVTFQDANDSPTVSSLVIDSEYSITNATNWIKTNEGTSVYNVQMTLDEGGSDIEITDDVRLTIKTSNSTLLPISAIKLKKYDDTEEYLVDSGTDNTSNDFYFGDGILDASLKALVMEFTPRTGQYGEAVLTITPQDSGSGLPKGDAFTIGVKVENCSAVHGGWENVYAWGDTVRHDTTTPITEALAYMEWNAFTTYGQKRQHANINILAAADGTAYSITINSTEYSITSGTSATTTTISAALKAQIDSGGEPINVSDLGGRLGIISSVSGTTFTIATPTPAGSMAVVELYDAATVTSSGATSCNVSGFKVYRATGENLTDFDFDSSSSSHSLIASNASSTLMYTDQRSAANTTVISEKALWYVVRPILNNIPSATDSSSSGGVSILRVVIPPKNMALVHRWIVNQEVCGKMGLTTIMGQNFRCAYTGLGGDGTYYDLEYDLVVDRFEAGCNYKYDECTDSGNANGCIGNDTPLALSYSASQDSLFYDRNSGECWINTNGSTGWANLSGVGAPAIADYATNLYNYTQLPPLVKVTQSEAESYCGSAETVDITNLSAYTRKLPNRKEWVAMSAWETDRLVLTDTKINTYEKGAILYTGTITTPTGGCNSTSAGGFPYASTTIPPSQLTDTLPSTDSNTSVRSLRTGSTATVKCMSRYGVQDLIGNVSEWGSERLANCGAGAGPYTCEGSAALDATTYLDTANFDFDGVTGPDQDTSTSTDAGWSLDDTTPINNATKFSVAVGVPLDSAYANNATVVNTDTTLFHEDYIFLNAHSGAGAEARSIINGGSWLTGSAGQNGRWTSDWTNTTTDVGLSLGFRCVVQIPH